MAGTYYRGNAVDTTTKDVFTNELLCKIVKQEIESKVFDDIFGVFTKDLVNTGFQVEEFEIGNLSSTDFDPTGADALQKANMDFKVLYHKINRNKRFKATISNKQIKHAMLSEQNMADVASAISNELYNSSAIEDYDAMKQLIKDIVFEEKKMVLCDMNGKGDDMDALTKAIQALAGNFALPSTEYNFSGFKREFNEPEDLVLIIDTTTRARMNVESLANAINIDKKKLVENIITIDKMPDMVFEAAPAIKGIELYTNGATDPITTYKLNDEGLATVSGKVKCLLVNKKAIIRDPVSRDTDDDKNGAGKFTNIYLFAEDILSYSTLKNAVAIID